MAETKTPIEIVTAFLDAMARKDYDTGLKLVADDCEYENLPMGKVTGPAGVRAVLEPFFGPVLENDLKVLRQASEGSLVFLERLDRHRLPDRWVELPVTGVFEVRDGKIAVWREYFDLQTLMQRWPELQAAA
ncbi:MAG: limonene-1,2-epoxide hydrolase family protein [Pseudomonadota bacterium]|jgi:limonene-1,2-epoxide hydrolase